MTLTIGSTLEERYRIENKLGEGGFGAVYQAVDSRLNVQCAVKESLHVTEEATRQFKREAEMLAKLRHPHLVRVTDYFIISGQGQYLVMDFVDGVDLHTALTNYGKALPLADTMRWTLQICEALIYIHSQNPPIIHRDIKPANIRVTPQNNAVLVDFGLAKAFEANAKTSTGARGLTPIFASPEQYGMGGTDAQSDIYSLGVTLYCMLTNRVPADSVDIMVGNAESPPPANAINKDVPEFVSDALQHAMQIRRTDRYKSAGDFKNALSNDIKEVIQVNAMVAKETDEDICHKAISANPNNVLNYYNLGELLNEQERYDEAADAYRKAISVEPKYVKAYVGLGVCLRMQKHLVESEDVYRQAIAIDPNCVEAHFQLGILLKGQNRLKDAEEFCRKAMMVAPALADSLYSLLGEILEEQERFKEAEEVYRNAIANNSNNGFCYSDFGAFLQSQGRFVEAERNYRQSILIDPNDSFFYYRFGEFLQSQSRFVEAEEAYLQLIAINSDDDFSLLAYYRLIDILDSQNRDEEAERMRKKKDKLLTTLLK